MRCVVKEIGKFSANGRDITSVCLDPTGEDALHVRHIDLQLFSQDGDSISVGDQVDIAITPVKQEQVATPEKSADSPTPASDSTTKQDASPGPEKPADSPTPPAA